MATSTKVTFDVDVLEDLVLKHHRERVKRAEEKLDRLGSPDDLRAEREAWRAECEKRVSQLFRALDGGAATDAMLSKFKLPEYPEWSRWDVSEASRAVERCRETLERAELKFKALKRNEDGSISLTSTQLRDYFGIKPE